MRIAVAIVLFMLAGALAVGGIVTVRSTPIFDFWSGLATVFGAFVLPGLLVWWGVIALRWRR